MPETTEEISRQPEVRKELARATGEKRGERVKARGRDKFWFVVYAVILVGCAAIYYLFTWKLIPLPQPGAGITERFLRGGALIVIMLTIARATRSEERRVGTELRSEKGPLHFKHKNET